MKKYQVSVQFNNESSLRQFLEAYNKFLSIFYIENSLSIVKDNFQMFLSNPQPHIRTILSDCLNLLKKDLNDLNFAIDVLEDLSKSFLEIKEDDDVKNCNP